MLDWLGDEGPRLLAAFRSAFGPHVREFGSPSLGVGGLSDGSEGVQWNAGIELEDEWRWVGVNLEGMEYGGRWPIRQLLMRERAEPTLPALIRHLGDPGPVVLELRRDYWQASSRPEIVESHIAPTPVPLRALEEEVWRAIVKDALACLNGARLWRGRAKQRVTLAASGRAVEGEVSPHLAIVYPAPDIDADWPALLAEGRPRLQPFYDWAVRRSAA